MSEPGKFLETLKDGRYNPALYAGAIFSIMLLIYKDMPDGRFKSIFVPSVGVFALGLAVICHIQSNISWAAHNRQKAAGGNTNKDKLVEGLQKPDLDRLNWAFVTWLGLYIIFLGLVFLRAIPFKC